MPDTTDDNEIEQAKQMLYEQIIEEAKKMKKKSASDEIEKKLSKYSEAIDSMDGED